jgi:osmotically-inducible protein OsmY
MTTHHQNGGRNSAPDDNDRSSWRPNDQSQNFSGSSGRANDDDRDYRSWRDRNFRDDEGNRDPRRWEGSRGSEVGSGGYDREAGRRSTEYYGQGQSGYSAGRYGDDRAQHVQMQNRNEMISGRGGSGSYGHGGSNDDRYRSSGQDDRFGDRGAWSYSQDRGGYSQDRFGAQGYSGQGYSGQGYGELGYGGPGAGYGNRGFDRGSESERRSSWSGAPSGYGSDETMGYQGESRGGQRMGYQAQGSQGQGYRNTSQGYGGSSQGYRGSNQGYRGDSDTHVHAGTGPHRGKGPSGYQRSDERLRELISESLADDDQLDASHIEVTVKNGDVVLTGWVEDRRAKRDAEDCVAGVSGVGDVQNQLRIQDDRQQSGKAAGAGQTSGLAASTTSYGTANGRVETESQDKKHRA